MSKKDDIDDLLGEDTAKPAKKVAAKKEAAPAPAKKVKAEPEAAPAKKVAAKKEAVAAEPKEKAKKTPITFEEGERQTITDGVLAHFKRSKKPINSKDLAAKLETETRKLRVVLYSLYNKGLVTLESGDSKVAGMTVSPA